MLYSRPERMMLRFFGFMTDTNIFRQSLWLSCYFQVFFTTTKWSLVSVSKMIKLGMSSLLGSNSVSTKHCLALCFTYINLQYGYPVCLHRSEH